MRSKLKVIKDILVVILLNKNIGPTLIMQKANISIRMFTIYLKYLLDKDLITKTTLEKKQRINGKKLCAGKKIFNITNKGREYLNKYAAIEDFLIKYNLEGR